MNRAWHATSWLAALAAIAALQACSTTVSTSSGPITDAPRDTRSTSPENDDVTRRARVRMELAAAYYSRGQLDVALDETKLALAADPNLGAAYNLRGLIFASKGDDAQAEESFRRALQIDPRDGDAMQNFGWYLCQRKRFPEADAQFGQALALPQNRDISRTLLAQGVCQAISGQLAEAERTLTRANELDPANPSTSVNLAEVLLRRGEYERARFHIRRVNNLPAMVSAQTLWLAARIESKLGNQTGVQELGRQLRERFGDSREAAAFARGQFNE
jgi:type IV pilus assembly protein PilF